MQYGLFAELFPDTDASLARPGARVPVDAGAQRAGKHRQQNREDKPVTPAFLFAGACCGSRSVCVRRSCRRTVRPPYQAVQRRR